MDWGKRGQSTVVGVTLVFALVIIGLGTTQAFVVPQQNAAVAQNHWEDAQDDLSQLRSVMDRIADRESSASVAVKLGQRLPDRPFLVEGTPPSGTLETRPVKITIRGQNFDAPADKDDDEVLNSTELNGSSPTKEIRYTQSGGDWQTLTSYIGPISTFVKQDGRVSQAVVEDGQRIDVLLLKGNLSAGGVSTENVQLTGIDRSCSAITGTTDTEITVARSGTPDRTIDWASGETRQVCLLVISINDQPISQPPKLSPDFDSNASSNDTLVNPVSPLKFECADQRGSSSGDKTIVDVTLNNTRSSTDVSAGRARIASYLDGESSGGSEIPKKADVINGSGSTVATLNVAGASKSLNPPIDYPANQEKTIAFDFSGSNSTQLDTFLFRYTLTDGRVLRYFAQVKKPGACNHAGTVGSGTAASVDLVTGSAVADVAGSSNGIQFELENSGSTGATVSEIKINGTNESSIKDVVETNSGTGEGNREVFIDASDNGDYEAGDTGSPEWDIGTRVSLSNQSTIGAGSTGTFYIFEFVKNNGTPVSMEDTEVTVTVFYGDGSKDTFVLEVSSP